MYFSDTTDGNGLIQDAEFRTGLGDAGISGVSALLKHFTRLINQRYEEVVTMILAAQDEWDYDDINYTDYPILSQALVAGQRDYPYNASEKVLKIKRVDITYDGVTYYKAEPFDISQYREGDGNDTNIDARFSKTSPVYDLKYNAFFIYPMASAEDVTNGATIRTQWTREVSEFTTSDTNKAPGLDTAFHPMLSIGASIDWLAVSQPESPQLPVLVNLYAALEARLKQHYGTKQQDRHYRMQAETVDYR